jgi:hypothetical protein
MDPFRDPSCAGLHWSIDPDTPEDERHQAHVTAAMLARYLRDHPINPAEPLTARGPVVLFFDAPRHLAYVRYPNGQLKWESVDSLRARRFEVPEAGVLEERGSSHAIEQVRQDAIEWRKPMARCARKPDLDGQENRLETGTLATRPRRRATRGAR